MTTDTEAREALELDGKATEGPWTVEDPMATELTIVEAGKPTYEWRFIASCSLPDGDDDQDFTAREVYANASFIAFARTALTMLAREVIRLGEENERLNCQKAMEIGRAMDAEERAEALRARVERLEAALRDIQQRANEHGPGPLGERETIYAMHDLAVGALAYKPKNDPAEKPKMPATPVSAGIEDIGG